MEMENKRIIIVGGGLAGTFLAANLVQKGASVIQYADPQKIPASSVAAGLVNPVTGRQFAISWKAIEFLTALESFFQLPGFESLAVHYHSLPIYRPFPDIRSCNDWTARSHDSRFDDIATYTYEAWKPEWLINPLGGMIIHRGGWLNVNSFINATRDLLQKTGRFQFIAEKINYSAIDPQLYQLQRLEGNIEYSHLVFCEGIYGTLNPWFPAKLVPLKGQLITFRTRPNLNRIISSGQFMVPLGEDLYRLGSTYELNYYTEAPDAELPQELVQGLSSFWLPKVTEWVKLEAGIRPTTLDRKPIIGQHPEWPTLWIFNGLGTKGVLQAPALATQLANAILNQSPGEILKDCNPYRITLHKP
jgi:glycine/D-amino acid oxidase-like deaminating enzyme